METIIESVPTFVAPSNILGLGNADGNTVPKQLFQPKVLHDILDQTFQKELTNFVKQNPHLDFVYKFDLPKVEEGCIMRGHECLLALPEDTGKGLFVAGSTALHYISSYVKGYNNINWKSTDIDVFFLNCPTSTRMTCPPGNLDMVFCKEKTVEEVLLNFDLPCCRVGFDFKFNFYVSAQALVAIFTGKMYLPEYFSSNYEFLNKLKEFECDKTKPYAESINSLIVKRFYERVKKYQSRGFKAVYTHLDYLLPWMKNRFTYICFSY